MIALTEAFDPPVDLARARAHAHADVLTTEFALFGVTVPAATTYNITLMRALMVPIADEALALALDRIWVFTTNADDVCCHDPAEAGSHPAGRRTARARRVIAEHPVHPAHVQRGRALL
ncbi:hypothetical protein GCM10010306_065360 [Streptomyces umbrinus]|nr:hypothetical protein GCM10010306_065360 [Streptomyces umbrinus]